MDLYSPLESSKSQIRLFNIDQTDSEGSICCRLRTVSLDENPKFYALSYACGDPTDQHHVIVNGHERYIYTSLELALRNIVGPCTSSPASSSATVEPNEVWIWADAICINQDDIDEKARQIRLMGRIYHEAGLVIAWLGNDPMTSAALQGFNLITQELERCSEEEFCSLKWLQNHPSLYLDDIGIDSAEVHEQPLWNRTWRTMTEMFRLPYWERVWTFQECALAQHLKFCTAEVSIEYDDIELLWKRLMKIKTRITTGKLPCPVFLQGQTVWTLLRGIYFEWTDIRRIFAGRGRGRTLYNPMTSLDKYDACMMSLIARNLQCSDPKDHIYGLISLTRIDLKIDYSERKTTADVYRDYARKLLEAFSTISEPAKEQPLMFLHYAGVGLFPNELGLPSYAPNLPEESIGGITGKYPDGTADRHAFSDDDAAAEIRGLDLIASGVKIDTVSRIEEVPDNTTWYNGGLGRYCKDFVTRNQPIYRQNLSPLRALVQTFRLNINAEVDTAELRYALALLFFIYAIDSEHPQEHLRAIGLELPADTKDTSPFDETFVRAYVPGHSSVPRGPWFQLFTSTEDEPNHDARHELIWDLTFLRKRYRVFETPTGRMGLGPVMMDLGDELFVLKGSPLPVMLRQRGDHWIFVGNCFVLDLMSGEVAAEIVQKGETAIERISIR